MDDSAPSLAAVLARAFGTPTPTQDQLESHLLGTPIPENKKSGEMGSQAGAGQGSGGLHPVPPKKGPTEAQLAAMAKAREAKTAYAQGLAPAPEARRTGIVKVNYSHDALIDELIANPMISQGDLAIKFGYSPGWISQVINSDAFQARMAARKGDLVDPLVTRSVEERLRAAASRSLDVVMEKLDAGPSADFALSVAKASTAALGYGARDRGPGGPQVAVVVQIPAPVASSADWSAQYSPGDASRVAPALPTVEVLDAKPGDQ